MPLALQREAEHEEAEAEDGGRGVGDDQAGFWVEAAGVAAEVEAADGVVEVVAREPAEEDADEAEEVEVT